MKTYSMTCTCSHEMTVEAETREEAVAKFKEMMSGEAATAHMQEKHAGEEAPTTEQVHAMIEETTKEVEVKEEVDTPSVDESEAPAAE